MAPGISVPGAMLWLVTGDADSYRSCLELETGHGGYLLTPIEA